MQPLRNVSALLQAPSQALSFEVVKEVFHLAGHPNTILSVQSLPDKYVVRTKIRSISQQDLTTITSRLRAQNVEIALTTRGLMFLLS